MNHFELAVFDLDGTLADTALDMSAAMGRITEKYGKSENLYASVKGNLGYGAQHLIEKVYESIGLSKEKALEDLPEYKREYALHCDEKTRLYPGVEKALVLLKQRKVTLVLATMKPQSAIQKVLDALHIREYFSKIYSYETMLRPKPDPWCIEESLAEFHADRDKTVIIGDSLVDINTGKNARCHTIAVLGGYFDQTAMRESGADHVITEMSEIINYF